MISLRIEIISFVKVNPKISDRLQLLETTREAGRRRDRAQEARDTEALEMKAHHVCRIGFGLLESSVDCIVLSSLHVILSEQYCIARLP